MVSGLVLAGFVAGAVLAVVWPLAIFLLSRRRMTLLLRNVLVGAGVFFVFSQVLEKALHLYVLKANPTTAEWLKIHPVMFALYGCLAAALFEEVGRYLGMRFLVKPSGDPGTAVAYGLGHGGIESILIGCLGMVQTLYLAILLNSGRLDTVLGPAIGPDMLAQLRVTLEHLSITGLALGTLERLIALLIQIGLSLLVWRAVARRRLAWLALAIAAHALIDFPPALFQAGLISTAVVESVLLIIGAALVAYFLYELPRKPAPLSADAAKAIEPAP